jgi:hypothetical protein
LLLVVVVVGGGEGRGPKKTIIIQGFAGFGFFSGAMHPPSPPNG